MPVPEGYNHKATSEGFNGIEKVSIHYHSASSLYIIYVHANQEEGSKEIHVSKAQLALIIHAGTDTLEMDSR